MTTTVEQVKLFWESRAEAAVTDTEVTHRDIWQRWLEVRLIRRHLSSTDRVIDVGCGNGHTTWKIAPLVAEVVGIDYSDGMIRRAHESAERPPDTPANISFCVGDVLHLSPGQFGLFDVAVSERCLINLRNWEEQQQAIHNIAGVLRPEGRFIFVEGCADGRRRLNERRESLGLAPMPPVWHNVDFDEALTLEFLTQGFVIEQRLHFDLYDLISRVVHPLVVAPDEPEYRSPINECAARLAARHQVPGGIGRVLGLVLRKKP